MLVQEAAAGSGVSYGALYDRYATQVFNYCLRLTGSAEDAGDATQEAFVNVLRRLRDDDRPVLDFASYLFAAARHESYALMRQRVRVHPSDRPPEPDVHRRVADVETDPERAVLLRDSQEAVREANAGLAPRHREVLALREVAGRSYDEIGATMGISENAAAQLIWRARTKLREALTAGAVASVVATSEECQTAQLLLNRIEDGEPVDEADREWLDEHLEECGSCRAARGVLLEVGASYRCWLPVALFAGMRTDTLTRAGELVGADWSQVPAKGQAGPSAGPAVAALAVLAALALALLLLINDDDRGQIGPRGEQPPASAPSDSDPAPGDTTKTGSDELGTDLLAARAPRSLVGGTGFAKPDVGTSDQSDGRGAPETRGAPDRRSDRAEDPPGRRPRSGPGPGAPAPSDPRAKPPPPTTPTPRDQTPIKPAPTPPVVPVTPPPVIPVTPPPPPSECSWPGGGNGPGGCPPGHGGVPTGQGGTPPGHAP